MLVARPLLVKRHDREDGNADGLTMEALAPVSQRDDFAPPPAIGTGTRSDDTTVMASSWLEHRFSRLLWVLLLAAPLGVSYYTHSIVGVSLTLALFAGLCTHSLVPDVGRLLFASDMTGRDLNKPRQPKLAESLGVAAGAVFLIAMFLFVPFPFMNWVTGDSPSTLETLGNYTAALLSISSMLFLGFADDVLNLKWRQKVLLPAMSALPLLVIYRLTSDRTHVAVPLLLRSVVGAAVVDVGVGYYVYMALLAVFCTHSINILAGVNGVEVGQSCVIGGFIVVHNLLCIWQSPAQTPSHLFSLFLMFPFLGVSLALLHHNWYPARVFVGDTFCYFAGMTFAVAGILGHFSKTLLLFFVPQVVNFLFSTPQLFGLVPCPRHRLPRLNAATGRLEASTLTIMDYSRMGRAGRVVLEGLVRVGVVRVTRRPTPSSPELTCTNFTLLSVLLVWFGPMREDALAMTMLTVQFLCCLVGLLLRHFFSAFFF